MAHRDLNDIYMGFSQLSQRWVSKEAVSLSRTGWVRPSWSNAPWFHSPSLPWPQLPRHDFWSALTAFSWQLRSHVTSDEPCALPRWVYFFICDGSEQAWVLSLSPASPGGCGLEVTVLRPWRSHRGRSMRTGVTQDWSGTYPLEFESLDPWFSCPRREEDVMLSMSQHQPKRADFSQKRKALPRSFCDLQSSLGSCSPHFKAGKLSQWIA